MDSTFINDYVRSVNGSPSMYYAEVYKTDAGQWRASFYNFTDGTWHDKVLLTGNGPRADGWSIFETYFPQGSCPALPDIQAQEIKVLTSSGSWVNLTQTYSTYLSPGPCFPRPYGLSVPNANYQWQFHYTP